MELWADPYPTPLKLQSWSLMLRILSCTPWCPPFFDRNIYNFESSFIFPSLFYKAFLFFLKKKPKNPHPNHLEKKLHPLRMLPVVFPGRFVTWGPCCSTFGTLGWDCYDHRLGGGESGTINGSSRTIQNGTPGTRNSSISEDLMKKKGEMVNFRMKGWVATKN